MELISVLMSTYNETESELSQSIESILHQTYRNIQFLIVNDNPANPTLAHTLSRYAASDSRIQIVENEQNLGLVASLNRGWKLAKGQYIARMDADDIALPHRLETQLAYLKSHSLDCTGAAIVHIDEQGQTLSDPLVFPETPEAIAKHLPKEDCVAHPTWFLKREMMEALNGYRDIRYCEDYDFLLRAVEKRYRIGNCPEVCLRYRIRSCSLTVSNRATQKLTSLFLSRNRKQLDRCTPETVAAYLDSREAKQYYAFTDYQTQQLCSPASTAAKALELFRKFWNSKFFWAYLLQRLRHAVSAK